MNAHLLCTLTVLIFTGSQVTGVAGYPLTSSYGDSDSFDQDFQENLASPFFHNLNDVNADVEEIEGQ